MSPRLKSFLKGAFWCSLLTFGPLIMLACFWAGPQVLSLDATMVEMAQHGIMVCRILSMLSVPTGGMISLFGLLIWCKDGLDPEA